MPNSKRPPESRSRLATSLAVVIVSRSMMRQIPVPIRMRRVEGVRVLLGQRLAAGEGRAPADRDVGVLGDEERLEAARFGLAGQLVDADRVVSGEDADADVHGILPGTWNGPRSREV